jgi:Leucine-rich repeat (LRR) protein
MPVISDLLPNAFRTVTEIQLNDTLMTWTDMRTITTFMPHLQVIEMGYNRLTRLAGDKPPKTFMNSSVTFINLDSNFLSEWTHLCASLKGFQSYVHIFFIAVRDIHCFNLTFRLARVVLASNLIENIPITNDDSDFLPGLKYLSLSDNRLSEWGAIDALARWCSSLENLVIKGNTLVAGKRSPSLVHCSPFHQAY